MHSEKKHFEKLRLLSVLIMIVAFVVLSYCPLRKTIQNLIKGTHETEQTNAGHNNKLSSVICLGAINISNTKITLPQTRSDISVSGLIAIVLTVFYFLRHYYTTAKSFTHNRYLLKTISLYLKNQILRI